MKKQLTILFTFLLAMPACNFVDGSDSKGNPGDLMKANAMCVNSTERMSPQNIYVGSNQDAYNFLCSESYLHSGEKFGLTDSVVECKVFVDESGSNNDEARKKEALQEILPYVPVDTVFSQANIAKLSMIDVTGDDNAFVPDQSYPPLTQFSLFFYKDVSGSVRLMWTQSRLWEFLGSVSDLQDLSWRARLQMNDLYLCNSPDARVKKTELSWDIHDYLIESCGWDHLYNFSFDDKGRLIQGTHYRSPNQIDCAY
jgi:hypothetical protein